MKARKKNINVKTQIDEANKALAEFKRLQIEQDCQALEAEAKSQKAKEETLATLTQLSDVSVGKAQGELAGLQSGAEGQGDDTKKLLIYGGIGLAALVAIILIARR